MAWLEIAILARKLIYSRQQRIRKCRNFRLRLRSVVSGQPSNSFQVSKQAFENVAISFSACDLWSAV
jgi:hypothetical protein